MNEELSCRKEEGSISDLYPVAFIKSGIIVGHMSRRISAACNLFIYREEVLLRMYKVIDPRHYSSDSA